MYTAGFYTLGCKVSLYETEAVRESFEARGFAVADFDSVCDVYVINTCTVTAESDAKSRKYIRRAIRKNPDAVVIVLGCYSQRAPKEVMGIAGVSAVIGTQDKLTAVTVAQRLLEKKGTPPELLVTDLEGTSFEHMRVANAERTRAYVKIEDGCECKCTYCAIASARGPVRSKPRCDVISEVEGLYKNGTLEVVLTGIETGSYGADFDEDYRLCDLLCELDARGSCKRIRLGSMAPELLSENFIRKVGRLSILTPHFHVSMQSGSDRVLAAMRRRYNSAQALANIDRIREYIPDCMITADLMVGFPGESEEDFEATLDFVRRARLLDAHVFAYSRRDGTPAASYAGQVPESTKRERSARLIAEKNRVRDEQLSKIVEEGKPLSCILESCEGGVYSAHSDSYVEVEATAPAGADSSLCGKLVLVSPDRCENGVVYGKITKIIT